MVGCFEIFSLFFCSILQPAANTKARPRRTPYKAKAEQKLIKSLPKAIIYAFDLVLVCFSSIFATRQTRRRRGKRQVGTKRKEAKNGNNGRGGEEDEGTGRRHGLLLVGREDVRPEGEDSRETAEVGDGGNGGGDGGVGEPATGDAKVLQPVAGEGVGRHLAAGGESRGEAGAQSFLLAELRVLRRGLAADEAGGAEADGGSAAAAAAHQWPCVPAVCRLL